MNINVLRERFVLFKADERKNWLWIRKHVLQLLWDKKGACLISWNCSSAHYQFYLNILKLYEYIWKNVSVVTCYTHYTAVRLYFLKRSECKWIEYFISVRQHKNITYFCFVRLVKIRFVGKSRELLLVDVGKYLISFCTQLKT